jgi:hypothetical protein
VPEHRALVARFLHFYPQYDLADLRGSGRLSYGEFMFLVGGMFDVESPEHTEPPLDRVNRLMRENAQKRGVGKKWPST